LFSKDEAISAMQYLSENYSSPLYNKGSNKDSYSEKFLTRLGNICSSNSIENL
jgi:hypothetical protein